MIVTGRWSPASRIVEATFAAASPAPMITTPDSFMPPFQRCRMNSLRPLAQTAHGCRDWRKRDRGPLTSFYLRPRRRPLTL